MKKKKKKKQKERYRKDKERYRKSIKLRTLKKLMYLIFISIGNSLQVIRIDSIERFLDPIFLNKDKFQLIKNMSHFSK